MLEPQGTTNVWLVENRLGVREGQRAALLRAKKLFDQKTNASRPGSPGANYMINEQTSKNTKHSQKDADSAGNRRQPGNPVVQSRQK